MTDEVTSDFNSRSKDEQKIINKTLYFVAERSARNTGIDFFHDLVTFLGSTLDVAFALCNKIVPDNQSRAETLALYANGVIAEPISYDLKDTPCDDVIGNDTCCYADNIKKRFPKDPLLVDMDAESYAGVPLWSSSGDPLGLIAVVDNVEIKNPSLFTTVLQIVSVRAGAELERVQVMEALKLSKQRFSDFANAGSDWFWEMDSELRFSYFSEQFEVITGYQPKLLIGKTRKETVLKDYVGIGEIKHQDDLENRRPFHDFIYTRKLDGGRQVWYSINGTPIYDEKGEFIGYRGTGKEITEKINMEDNLRLSQKMDALGHLTAGIAHDYNNTLGVILGYTALLKKQLLDHPKLSGYVDHIHKAGERGAKLTKRLLAFSQKQSIEEQELNINHVLLTQQDMLQKTMTVRIKVLMDLEEELWPVKLDHNELEDLILNICINALHAMEDLEKLAQLTIRTKNLSVNTLEAMIFDISPGDYIQLSFTDTGCGMNEVTRDKIFEPFFTTKGSKGTGLGLSQAFGFVKRSGGTITISSVLGQGSEFTLYFPRDLANDNLSTTDSDTTNQALVRNERILIVDDEDALRKLTAEIFSDNGYQVFSASNGQQALKILTIESIDLMISDVIMPDINGFQLAAKVQEKYPQVKIQLVSGFSEQTDTELINDELHSNIIHKPFEAEYLLSRVRDLLDNCHQSESSVEDTVKNRIPLMQWSDDLNIGQAEIDEDHKKLFNLINRCIVTINNQQPSSALEVIISELFDYTKYHFQREENFFKEHNYSQLVNHKLLHTKIVEQLQQKKTDYEQGNLTAESLIEFLSDWLRNHILKADTVAISQCLLNKS